MDRRYSHHKNPQPENAAFGVLERCCEMAQHVGAGEAQTEIKLDAANTRAIASANSLQIRLPTLCWPRQLLAFHIHD